MIKRLIVSDIWLFFLFFFNNKRQYEDHFVRVSSVFWMWKEEQKLKVCFSANNNFVQRKHMPLFFFKM